MMGYLFWDPFADPLGALTLGFLAMAFMLGWYVRDIVGNPFDILKAKTHAWIDRKLADKSDV